MEDSRMDAAPGAPLPVPGAGWQIGCWRAGCWRAGWGAGWDAEWEQPSERACPVVVLTPVAEPHGTESWAGAVYVVVAGMAVLAITIELGRRVGVPAKLTALCSVAGAAAVAAPRLVSAAPRLPTVPRPWVRPASAAVPVP